MAGAAFKAAHSPCANTLCVLRGWWWWSTTAAAAAALGTAVEIYRQLVCVCMGDL